jgi:NAD+ diphosphatase
MTSSSDTQPSFVSSVLPPDAVFRSIQWYLVHGDRLVVDERGGQVEVISTLDVTSLGFAPSRVQFLGTLSHADETIGCDSGELPEATPMPVGFAAVDLRRLAEEWQPTHFGIAGRAKQIVAWDRDHQFCSRCGEKTEAMRDERAKRCPHCGLTSYPRLSPAIIIAVTRRNDVGEQILLARNHRFPAGRYSVIAGFAEPGETLEECAMREVYEEVGIRIHNIRYFGSQPWPFPNSLMIGFTGEYAGGTIHLEASEIAEADWFLPTNLPLLPPRISIARQLIDAYVARNHHVAAQIRDW